MDNGRLMNTEELSDWNSRAAGREEGKLGKKNGKKIKSTGLKNNQYFDQYQGMSSHQN